MSDRSELGMSNATSVGMPGTHTLRDMRSVGRDLADINVGLNQTNMSKHSIKNQAQNHAQLSGSKRQEGRFHPPVDQAYSPYSPGQRLQDNTMGSASINSAILMNVGNSVLSNDFNLSQTNQQLQDQRREASAATKEREQAMLRQALAGQPNVSAFNPGVTGSASQSNAMLDQSFLTDNELAMSYSMNSMD